MIKFFEIQIRLGRISMEQVPEAYRDAVRNVFGATEESL